MAKFRPDGEHTEVLRILHSNRTDMMGQKDGRQAEDEISTARFEYPFPAFTMFGVVLMMFVVWQRKLQFDRKGFHKKRESDVA
jgi:hypothetical protein